MIQSCTCLHQDLMASSSQYCNAVSVRLDDTNYPTWLYLMQHHLRGHGLLKFVDGSYPCPAQFLIEDDGTFSSDNSGPYERWLEQDSSAICMITNTLSADALTLAMIGCQTSKEVWATLKQRYGSISEFRVMQLKITMQNIKKGSDSIEKYLLRFKSVRDKLAAVGVRMSDQDVKVLILAGLPSEYGHTRQIIRGKYNIDLEDVRSLLLSAESEIELEHKALLSSSLAAMVAQNNLANPSQSMQYGIPSAGMSSHAIFPSQYTGNCSIAPPALQNAASNVGFKPNVINTSMMSGVPAYNHFNTSSSGSSVHHYNAPSPISSTHFGIPQNNMISSSALTLPTAAPNCQEMVPFTSNIGIQQSVPNFGYMLNNSLGNGNYFSSAQSYCHAPQNGNSMIQNGGFMAPNGGHMVQNGGYGSVPEHNYSQQQGFSNNNGSYNNIPLQQGLFSQATNNSFSDGGYTEDNMSYPNFLNKGANYSSRNYDKNKPRNNNHIVCQICEKPWHSASKRYYRNGIEASTSIVECQICKRPGHSAKSCYYRQPQVNTQENGDTTMVTGCHIRTERSSPRKVVQPRTCAAPKALSASIFTQPMSFSNAAQPSPCLALQGDNASQSQVISIPITLEEIDSLSTQGTWQLLSTSQDRPLLHCRQATHPMDHCRTLPLIPPG